ncbi:MAG TPA: lamin tail domain-containing protein, partial [Clostridia bacterium]|nr:lamin tail domain-containing protein [Clostridia bacterium]
MKKGVRALLALFVAALAVVFIAIYLTKHASQNEASTSALEISEIMSSNKGSVADPNGDYPDWIEFHNTSDETLDIGGLGASDDVTAGVKYVFPVGTSVEANGYVVLWCSGEATDASHAPFRISAADSVVLFGKSGNTLETLVMKAVDSGLSWAKDASGAWAAMKPSPGFSNDEAGVAAYEATLMSEVDAGIYINEFMASNSTTLMDAYGAYSDWIELYNATDKDYDLSGGGISDTITQPKKYIFPEGTVIPAHGYLVVFCSGNEGLAENGELHVPFGLRAYGEDVVLTAKDGAILDSVTYTAQQTDASFARVPDGTGEFGPNTHPTPGYPNDEGGYSAFMAANAYPRGSLSISEIIGANISAKAAADGICYDLIELHNAGAEPVSLLGYALSNNPNNPGKWYFPDVTIPAGGYLLVYASELDKYEGGELHANFAVSRDGDIVCLFSPEGEMLDKLQSGAFVNDVSYGRDADGKLAYFTQTTFGQANGTGYAGITAVPNFDTVPGIYDGELAITLSAPEGETIHYTTDCTTPTASSPVYTAPIPASKNTVVRAVSVRDGYITNETATGTFLFKSDGVNHALPIVTLVTDPDNLWSNEKGIYAYGDDYDGSLAYGDALLTANFFENTDEWERPASFSVFDESKMQVFSQNVGISIAGAYGRGRAQKGFNIIARDEYGADRLAYPFFDGLEYTEYKSVVLRAGAQDQNRSKIRDELA